MQGTVSLRSVHGKYLSAQPDGRAEWNRDHASTWEYFQVEQRHNGKIALKGAHGMYVSAQHDGSVQINRREAPPGGWEEFTVEDRGNNVVCLKSCHGKYLSAQQDGTAQWNRDHAPRGGWEDIQFMQQGGSGQEAVHAPEPIEILEAVAGKPVRFKLNNPPNHNEAWVGIYPTSAINQEHGAPPQWRWLRDIDANNVSLSNGELAGGDWSIRVFSDGGYTLVERKDFQVKAQTVASQPLDETAEESTKNAAKIAFGIGIFLIMPGLPLLIIGSTSTGEDRLAMIIPGAILTGIGSLALIILLMIWGGSRQRKQDGSQKSSIDILEATTNKGVYFRINNPPNSNDAWVGIYPRGSEDSDHGEEGVRWHWLRDIDLNKARFYENSEGHWSIRVFSDSGYTLDSQDDFEILPKDDQWWKD